MSEISRFPGSSPSAEQSIVGPDYFGFYAREIAVFLSQDEDYLPFLAQNSNFGGQDSSTQDSQTSAKNYKITGHAPLFSDAIGGHLSDFRKERLRSLVRQSLFTFREEVDEIVNPVHKICRVQSLLRYKKSMLRLPSGSSESDQGHPPHKKQKVSTLSSSLSGSRGTKISPEKESQPLTELNSELVYLDKMGISNLNEIDNDLLVLLDNDCTMVEEMTKKHSNELLAAIRHMEQKLEEFLDILMSNCRSMTLAEKQKLRKLIQNLPPRDLDRVAEIIQRDKPTDRFSCDEIYIDLEKENKVTLWRLYYYAAGNAQKIHEA